ncbi:lantibiotic dehydratase [Cryomorpha ignava]|uniref:Lantibiotic dehydratase n=1 Tax=Cryomorpha ignava TaxID=101383 RepID=A0A7K3WT09_9FLAO|nr:lantibiotic dehydratase [Cryomorpha ignava]NEN23795.1 lantibiotic dehydratase [Cryomorpha ignava]
MKYSFNEKTILRIPAQPLKTSFSKEELLSFFSKNENQEALFLSSPDLLDAFNKQQAGDVDSEKEKKLITSLLKYATRMHSRCTPFGLFAGCGIIESNIEDISVNTGNIQRSTRLDMHFTCALAQKLAELPYIQKHLKFYPNSSLYCIQDKIRYVEYFYRDKIRIHKISAVDNSVYLQTILQKAAKGATINELVQSILSSDIRSEVASAFVKEIISAQILISDLEPGVSGEELLIQTIEVLNGILKCYEIPSREMESEKSSSDQELRAIIELLENTKSDLLNIDHSIKNDILVYKQLVEKLSALEVPFELNKLFQTDMFIAPHERVPNIETSIACANNPTEQSESEYHTTPLVKSKQETTIRVNRTRPESGRKDNELQKQITKALTVLNQLTAIPSKTNLTEFKEKFFERYEDEEVALLEALDTETGIGYALNTNRSGDLNPLVNDLYLSFKDDDDTKINWNKRQSFLFKKLLKAHKDNDHCIVLKSEDLKDFKSNWDDLPDSFSVMYKHHGKRDERDLISVENAGGSSATYLLGRFASGNKAFDDLVNNIAKSEKEKNPKVILAEIVHLPENRVGNILMRPIFRNYEIPYLSNSSLPKDQQITLNDLFISIKYNQLVLWSKKLNKQVIPRMGNAHNFSFNSLPVYHLLCDLQTQNIRGGIYFDWGSLKHQFAFLPRVEVDNVILSFATWQLKKDDYQVLLKKEINIMEVVLKLRKKWRLPQLIMLADGDNELLVDLENRLSVEMLISMIKKRPGIVLKEFLFDEKTAKVTNEQGNAYVNEFIAILEKKKSTDTQIEFEKTDSVRSKSTQAQVQRFFAIGSEWLYFKIYCGVRISDKILTDVIKPLTQKLIKDELIDSWFFIRYADPELHLRIRFHFTDLKNIGHVIVMFQTSIDEYIKSGMIWKVQTDTYKREIQRYGSNTIELAEQLFHFDSDFVVGLLDEIYGDEGEDIRWLISIRSVDKLLSDFNYSMASKQALMENLKLGFAHEFNMDKSLKIQLDKKYRKHRSSIESILKINKENANELSLLFEFLEMKSRRIKPIAEEILSLNRKDELSMPLNDLLASYIHMLLNRLFKNKQRLHEMVLYDFMWRTYRSELARSKKLNKV